MRRFGHDGGGIATLVALAGGVVCVLAAITIDVGSIALTARRLQGTADLAALSAARDRGNALSAARATATDNIGPSVGVTVVLGRYIPDPSIAPDRRFSAGGLSENAARVTLTSTAPLYFGRWFLGRQTVDLTRSATAATAAEPPRAVFSIGSRLAGIDGGIANAVLSGLTGSTVSLSVMDYRALAGARVNLLEFSDALATDLELEAGDYTALLSQTVDAGAALSVLAAVTKGDAARPLGALADAATGVEVQLGHLIGAEAGAQDGLAGPLDATVSAMDLAMALLEVGSGDRQATLALGARTGLADVTAMLAIGERPNRSPWLTVTGDGTPVVRTAQARLYVKARTAQALSGLKRVDLPILIELAASEARLDRIACEPDRAVELGVRPGLARIMIGAIDEDQLNDFTRPLSASPATLLSVLGLVTVTARAEVEVADQGFTPVIFSDAEIADQVMKSVQARGKIDGIAVSLLRRLEVDVDAAGLGLGLGGLVQALSGLLTPLGPVLDGLINPILDVLGLRLGEADVRVHGAHCSTGHGRAVLVG